MTEQSPEAPAC